jgi:hypothetical protein
MKTKWKIAAVLALGLGTAAPGWAALQDSLTITSRSPATLGMHRLG